MSRIWVVQGIGECNAFFGLVVQVIGIGILQCKNLKGVCREIVKLEISVSIAYCYIAW